MLAFSCIKHPSLLQEVIGDKFARTILIDVFAETGQWVSHQASQTTRASYLTTKIWVSFIGATANLLTITVTGFYDDF